MEEKIRSLNQTVKWYKDKVGKLVEELFDNDKQIKGLQEKADDLDRVKRHIGTVQIDNIIEIERKLENHIISDDLQVRCR